MTPRVSVLIPTYNYAHYLPDAIESVLNQTYSDFELVIVDNNSQDNTDEVVARYTTIDSRIRYYKNESNIGLSGNWNKCLDYATGTYIKFLCADDKFHPTMLEKFTRVMDENPSVSLVTCFKEVFHANSFVTTVNFQHLKNGKEALLNTLNDHCWIGEPSSVMFRRKDLDVGKFTGSYMMHVDWEMWLRILSVGDCYIVPEVLSFIRFHAEQHAKKMKKLQYVVCFEEYRLAKDVQLNKHFNYQVAGYQSEIKKAVRKRASICVRLAMYKVIPKLHRRETWPFFRRAFIIGIQEGVFIFAMLELFKGLRLNTVRYLQR